MEGIEERPAIQDKSSTQNLHSFAAMDKHDLLSRVLALHHDKRLSTSLPRHHDEEKHKVFLAKLKEALEEPSHSFFSGFFHCQNWKFDTKRRHNRMFHRMDILLLSMLSLVELLSTSSRVYLGSSLTLLMNDTQGLNYSLNRHGQLLYGGIIAASIGKVTLSFFLDLGDPLMWMACSLFTSALCVLLQSQLPVLVHTPEAMFPAFSVLFAVNIFAQSVLLASINRYLHDHFKPAQYGRSLSIIAVGAKLGSIISSFVMASISLTLNSDWSQCSFVASMMCFASLIPLALVKLIPHPALHLAHETEEDYLEHLGTHTAKAPPKVRVLTKLSWAHFSSSIKRFVSWFRSKSFLLICIANGGMAVSIAFEGFDQFISIFIRQSLSVPGGFETSFVSIFFHLGAIASLVFGGVVIEALNRPSQARAVMLLMLLGCLGLSGLTTVTAMVSTVVNIHADRFCFFLLGLGFGYPYSVTVSTFAIHFGGQQSALVTQTISLFGLAICSCFVALVAILVSSGWYLVCLVMLGFGLAALIAMFFFHLLEWQQRLERKIYGLLARHLFHSRHQHSSHHHHHDQQQQDHHFLMHRLEVYHPASKLWGVLSTVFFLSSFVASFVCLDLAIKSDFIPY